MTQKPDPIERLLKDANKALEYPAVCSCGNCQQAVLRAEEIMRNTPDGDCAVWMATIAAMMFARAANALQEAGMPPEMIQAMFVQASARSNHLGDGYQKGLLHFRQDIPKTPRKDAS